MSITTLVCERCLTAYQFTATSIAPQVIAAIVLPISLPPLQFSTSLIKMPPQVTAVQRSASVRADAAEYRIVVFGNAAVGKTSLINRFLHDSYHDHYSPTVEDTYRRVILSDTALCTLIITDTGGSHSFPAMERLSIQRAHAFILVYTVDNRQSFDDLQRFRQLLTSVRGSLDSLPLIIIGNKSDTGSQQRCVSEAEAMTRAKQWKCACIETSAKQSLHIREAFDLLVQQEQKHKINLDNVNKQSRNKSRRSLSVNIKRETVKRKCVVM